MCEVHKLVVETDCECCIDFAHVLARYKKYMFKEVFKKFKDREDFHIHFSGIEYGEKGERRHIMTPSEGLKDLIKSLPKNKEITIINESPDPVAGAIMGVKIIQE
jgi:endonuclease IV